MTDDGVKARGQRFDPWQPRILDGALGTELGRRGVNIALPLWSANALLDRAGRTTLSQIHREYAEAGADILTANTFRTQRRTLAKVGLGERALELTQLAVDTAREASPRSNILIAGSMAPLEDCYRPDLAPSSDTCAAEHGEMAAQLAEAGVDLILVETMGTVREAVIATQAAVATGLPVFVCFACRDDGRILSGKRLRDAAKAVAPLGVAGLGVNCTPAPAVAACLDQLPPMLPRVAYANIGHAAPDGSWELTDAVDPAAYARYAASWPAQIIGGCCGTTPAHVRRVVEMTRERERGARPDDQRPTRGRHA